MLGIAAGGLFGALWNLEKQNGSKLQQELQGVQQQVLELQQQLEQAQQKVEQEQQVRDAMNTKWKRCTIVLAYLKSSAQQWLPCVHPQSLTSDQY